MNEVTSYTRRNKETNLKKKQKHEQMPLWDVRRLRREMKEETFKREYEC